MINWSFLIFQRSVFKQPPQKEGEKVALTVAQFQSVLLMLVCGITVSIFIFLFELMKTKHIGIKEEKENWQYIEK